DYQKSLIIHLFFKPFLLPAASDVQGQGSALKRIRAVMLPQIHPWRKAADAINTMPKIRRFRIRECFLWIRDCFSGFVSGFHGFVNPLSAYAPGWTKHNSSHAFAGVSIILFVQ
ncbi:hypothetical protein, partial [Parapedobacter tibetensis]|uniref:hypothetical protein n=1 Tax=Parapedobacter tibetensis TaxID=2972951 RepID=UPI00214DE63D